MNSRQCSALIPSIRTLAVATAVAISSLAMVSLAQASRASDRKEQTRYAQETVALPYDQFLQRKSDFWDASNCQNRWPETLTDPPIWQGCNKPLPYNWFDWTSDGCSWTPPALAARFNGPCQLHDFGYRNFGKGLTVQRNETRRKWIDDRFKTEMDSVCNTLPGLNRVQRSQCRQEARVMYEVVRRRSDWSN
jgi:hypothetical protein